LVHRRRSAAIGKNPFRNPFLVLESGIPLRALRVWVTAGAAPP
jgi:hypothetical protein